MRIMCITDLFFGFKHALHKNANSLFWFQEDVVKPLLEVTKTALLHDCTLLCGWRYLSGLKCLGKVLCKNDFGFGGIFYYLGFLINWVKRILFKNFHNAWEDQCHFN